jgi:hypothetical protein
MRRFTGSIVAIALFATCGATRLPTSKPSTGPRFPQDLKLNAMPIGVADRLYLSASKYCRSLSYPVAAEKWKDATACAFEESMTIYEMDAWYSLLRLGLTDDERIGRKHCFAEHWAKGGGDVRRLEDCLSGLADHVASRIDRRDAQEAAPSGHVAVSSYCQKVGQAGGGSYVIMEECQKEEDAAEARLRHR